MAFPITTQYTCLPAVLTLPVSITSGNPIGAWVQLGTTGANANGYALTAIKIGKGPNSVDEVTDIAIGTGIGGSQVLVYRALFAPDIASSATVGSQAGPLYIEPGIVIPAATNVWAACSNQFFGAFSMSVSIQIAAL